MTKAERGTPKDIAKRIKAKGLQKLKFWCQVCQKQCRDANGFKCHLTSDAHLRHMKLFSEHATTQMQQYSREFEQSFLDVLRTRHGTTLANANHVYQQVIQDKQHTHMNATVWATLTDFVKYLGKVGKCIVQENERGWYVQYIERDATKLARQEAVTRRLAAENEAEMLLQERMERQRQEAAKAAGGEAAPQATSIEWSEATKISLAIPAKPSAAVATVKKFKKGISVLGDFGDDEGSVTESDAALTSPQSLVTHQTTISTHTNLEKKPKELPSNWLLNGIMVRIVDETSPYFRTKAAVAEIQPDGAYLSLTNNDDGEKSVFVPTRHLETVVPKTIDKEVLVLAGDHRGTRAKIRQLDKKNYRAVLQLHNGLVVQQVNFDHFSQLA